MDSKLKTICITVVTLLGATVLLFVYALNQSERPQNSVLTIDVQETTTDSHYEGSLSASVYDKYALNPDKDPYAFLQDDAFFDQPPEEINPANVLSLEVSTVQKDLRIHIVDGYGQLLTNADARVKIRSVDEELPLEEHADNDADGRIYLSNLKAGAYALSLLPLAGYEVPTEELVVKVSDEISYTVLHDISFLICSEDEIDVKAEDTEVKQAEEDADGTETNVRLADGASVFGIDVSKWNKEIDWEKVKAEGVEFAIIRCGYRGSKTGALVEDPYFKKNMQGAIDADIRVGAYFFTQAVTPTEAVEEASMVLDLCRQYKLSYPLFIDTEGAGGNGRADGLDKQMRTAVCKAFCETIENAGFTGGIYASKSWLNNNLDMDNLSSYEVWLAQYSKQATYDGEYDMWQYTSAGRVDGIATLVDFNVSYRDF